MGLFRRKREETLNEQMLREAGLDAVQTIDAQPAGEATAPEDAARPARRTPASQLPFPPPSPTSDEDGGDEYKGSALAGDPAGILFHAFEEPGDWDVVVTANAPALDGHYSEFVSLQGTGIVLIEGSATGDLAPLAEAVEHRLRPPYRALARRQDHELWSVSARQVIVIGGVGDTGGAAAISITSDGRNVDVQVDGKASSRRFLSLEQAGEVLGGRRYRLRAEHLTGDLWELHGAAL